MVGCGKAREESVRQDRKPNSETQEDERKQKPITPSPIDENVFYGSADQEDIHLYAYKDSFYNMIYHVELKLASNFPLHNIQWEIKGGRYHIYDDEILLLKNFRPLQKTILFLEKNTYVISATVFNDTMNTTISKSMEVDVSRLLFPNKVKMAIESAQFELWLKEKINLAANIYDSIKEDVIYQWEVKRLKDVTCPDVVEEHGYYHVCEQKYEEEIMEGKDYLLDSKDSQKTAIQFIFPGQYVVYFWLFNTQNQPLSRVAKVFTVEARNHP